MVSWSALGRSFGINILKTNVKTPFIAKFTTSAALNGSHGHKVMPIQPSRWQWHKFKDMFHYYLMVGFIPVGLVTFYANVFVGPAQLSCLPEDSTPHYWEYHRHPITRFIARYLKTDPQQEYEKFLHFIDEEQQKIKLRALQKDILAKMAERQDYQAYYYRPMVNKYLRMDKQSGQDVIDRSGTDYRGSDTD